MFKKFLSVFLSLLLVVGLVACGGGTITMTITESNEQKETQTKVVQVGNLKQQLQNAVTVTDMNIEYERDKNDQFINEAHYNDDKLSTVFFGSYPQSDVSGYTKDPIEWYVLEKNDSKALLLSKYILDTKPYNNDDVKITWENCSLRVWLNNDFYNYAFSNNEKNNILDTNVVNNDNEEYGTKGGNNTKDKIFLLSADECKNYLVNFKSINTTGTSYAPANYQWWLRSPGSKQSYARLAESGAYSNPVGWLAYGGSDLWKRHGGSGYAGVRPALWVKY